MNSSINQIKYYLGATLAFPLLPVMYFQSKIVRARVPKLPEATGNEGETGNSGRKLSLLTLGESSISGVGAETHEDALTGQLARFFSENDFNVKWKAVGRNGYTAKRVREELLHEIGEFVPDLIVIGLGANDAFRLNSPLGFREDMKNLLLKLMNGYPKAKILIANMPRIIEFTALTPLLRFFIGNLGLLFREELIILADELENVEFFSEVIDFVKIAQDEGIEIVPEMFFSDGVHPSLICFRIWANEIGKFALTRSWRSES